MADIILAYLKGHGNASFTGLYEQILRQGGYRVGTLDLLSGSSQMPAPFKPDLVMLSTDATTPISLRESAYRSSTETGLPVLVAEFNSEINPDAVELNVHSNDIYLNPFKQKDRLGEIIPECIDTLLAQPRRVIENSKPLGVLQQETTKLT